MCVLIINVQVLDYLAIAVHELANMSERRQERLMNPGRGRGRGSGGVCVAVGYGCGCVREEGGWLSGPKISS